MATLVYSDVDGTDRSFSLGPDPIMVGRAPECAIRSNDPRVSRVHAKFFVDQGALWVEDLGSANGIYVGPNKVQRAPVPTGEIVLVGSLMIRLLPPSGTLPPPNGLHGTLATWLEMERKARVHVEEERDAFVKRVGEMFDEVKNLRDATAAHEAEATQLRDELDKLKRASVMDLEAAKLEAAKSREAKIVAETQAGINVAEKLAESDMMISGLEHEIAQLKAAAAAAATGGEARLLTEQLAVVTARAEKAEKELATAQIRAQGAERNLAGANTSAAKAETKASELEHRLADAGMLRAQLETDLAAAREKAAALEARAASTTADAALQAAEQRAAKLAAELAEMTQQFETRRDRMVELEKAAADAVQVASAAEAKVAAAKAELADADKRIQDAAAAQAAKVAAAETRAKELEARLRSVGGAEAEIAAARKTREDARETMAGAEKRIADAIARADDSEKRASAADTMAKAMAKDVAEALRRAADVDSKARAVARELDGAHRRAEEAEKRDAASGANLGAMEARAIAAETKLAEVQQELADKVAAVEQQLGAKADKTQKDLEAKLVQAQRELAAERQTAMTLVDRKTQLERELSDLRTSVAGIQQRAATADSKLAEYEVQVETLEERIQDLESGIAVEQTASQSTASESKERVTKLEEQLAEAKAAAKTALKTAAGLEKRIDAGETELKAHKDARAAVEAELAEARKLLADAAAAGDVAARAAAAEARAAAAESQLEPLAAKADAADLAIGRASAVQRQLDEALQKLSWLERDSQGRAQSNAEVSTQIEAAEARAREAEARARDEAGRAEALDAMMRDAEARARELEVHARASDTRAAEVDARARDIEARAKDAAERIVDAERRAREAGNQLAEMSTRLQAAEAKVAEGGGNAGLERALAQAQARIAELKREVDAAENVRQFAANTEREIAQLEREIRDGKAKVTQITLERDRLASQLRDLRDDSETTNRRAPVVNEPEVTAQADLSRYTALVARASELEQKLAKMEKEDAALKRKLQEAEARAAAQQRAHEDEPTNTGAALPIEFAEHLSVLEESIDSLRANMRAASDETAMMDQTESVVAIASAVSQAAEHVERARDALRVLGALVTKQ